jgi:hypothetical protein
MRGISASPSRGMGKQFDRMGQHLAPGGHDLCDDGGGTRASVTSIAVSIIDRTKPLMPKP